MDVVMLVVVGVDEVALELVEESWLQHFCEPETQLLAFCLSKSFCHSSCASFWEEEDLLGGAF